MMRFALTRGKETLRKIFTLTFGKKRIFRDKGFKEEKTCFGYCLEGIMCNGLGNS